MFNHERHSGKLFITCIILFILMLSFFIAFLVEKNKSPSYKEPTAKNISVCSSPDCLASGKFIKEALDESVDPCDDFYEYSCGNWLRQNRIPDSELLFGMMARTGLHVKEKLKGLLTQSSNSTTDAEDKAKIFYRSCINEDTDEKGIQGITEMLRKLGGWPLLNEWKDSGEWQWWKAVAMAKSKLGVDIILGTDVRPGLFNTSRYSLYMITPTPDEIQVGLGQMSITHFVNTAGKAEATSSYNSYILAIACLINSTVCGSTTTAAQISELVTLENRFDEIEQQLLQSINMHPKGVILGDTLFQSPTLLRANEDDPRNYVMKVKDLKNKIPNVDWENFLKILLNDSLVKDTSEIELVTSIPYLQKVINLLSGFSKEVIANYVGWKAVQYLIPYSSENFRKVYFDLKLKGFVSEPNRSDTCMNLAASEMGFAVTSLYSSSFVKEDITYAKKLITNIRSGFVHTLNNNGWLDKSTKEQAINKLKKMEENVAFPPWNTDINELNRYYQKLGDLSETEFLKNAISAKNVNFLNEFSRLSEPVDKKNAWPVNNPMIMNAFYYSNLNSFYLPAGIMDFPFISRNSLESLNFGGIGYIIGHEIMHGFDSTGAQFDEMGQLKNWWTKDAMINYKQREACMVEQYRNTPEEQTKININGELTKGENIADNGGIKGAYWGYKLSVNEDIRLQGLESTSGDKLFFISAAQIWCTNTRTEGMQLLLQTDSHSPPKYRVNIPFGNSMEFIETFKCNQNTKMNLKNKCVIF